MLRSVEMPPNGSEISFTIPKPSARISVSLPISDGWNCSGPAPIQRLADRVSEVFVPCTAVAVFTSDFGGGRKQLQFQVRGGDLATLTRAADMVMADGSVIRASADDYLRQLCREQLPRPLWQFALRITDLAKGLPWIIAA